MERIEERGLRDFLTQTDWMIECGQMPMEAVVDYVQGRGQREREKLREESVMAQAGELDGFRADESLFKMLAIALDCKLGE